MSSQINLWLIATFFVVIVFVLLIVLILCYIDRKHWRMRAIEAETMQGLLQEEVDYLRTRHPAPLKLVDK